MINAPHRITISIYRPWRIEAREHKDRGRLGIGPGVFADPVEQPPQRGDAPGADGEADVLVMGGAGQRAGEVPAVRAHRYPQRPDRAQPVTRPVTAASPAFGVSARSGTPTAA
jgi:hypothetical protein